MGLFSKKDSRKSGGRRAFVFYCKTKDQPLGNITWVQLGDTMRQMGCTVPFENITVFQPDWNETVYSKTNVSGREADDMVAKVKAAVQRKGGSYQGEPINSFGFAPKSTFGSMGLFIVWYQTV